MVIHLIPSTGSVPIGAKLLPIFYVPLLALIFFGLPMALIVSLAGPLINYLLTGSPHGELVTLFTFELFIFTVVTGILLRSHITRWISAPLGFVTAKAMSMGLLVVFPLVQNAPMEYFGQTVTNGFIGILILTLITIGAIKYRGN